MPIYKKEFDKSILERFPTNTVLVGYRGSVAHNMYVPPENDMGTDDIDLMGVFMAPVTEYLGLKTSKGTVESFVDEYDIVSYEFKKFVRLLLNCNPNVLSLLWLNKEHYVKSNFYGDALLNNRDLFLSKKVYKSYTGYAYSQLKKMTAYKCEGYMGQKRRRLIERFGFDTKMASHSLRLLSMSIETLNTGKLNVHRTADVDVLLDIKMGRWRLDEVQSEADEMFRLAKEAYDGSELPDGPDYDAVETMVCEVMSDYLSCYGGV